MSYRRADAPGGCYFFTVNLADRRSDLLVRHMETLRAVTREVKAEHPFEILAIVVLPEHLHALWRLPPGDADFPVRWSLIKAGFSRRLAKEEPIRDETDLARHVDYIHFNPVKHGWASRPVDWPYSTLHRYIERGMATPDWGGQGDEGAGGYGER